jgi:hypothetical protein
MRLPTPNTARDPLLDHPAVLAYRQWVHLTPNDEQRRQIANAIGQTSDALARWAAVLQDWRLNGWRPQNVGGMLDRYRGGTSSGGTPKGHVHNTHGSAASRRVQALRACIETRKDDPPRVWNNDFNPETWGYGKQR